MVVGRARRYPPHPRLTHQTGSDPFWCAAVDAADDGRNGAPDLPAAGRLAGAGGEEQVGGADQDRRQRVDVGLRRDPALLEEIDAAGGAFTMRYTVLALTARRARG
jgi:hypothetical protein